MADPTAIARRHGIEHLAHKLVGTTAAELEADAAAKAALIRAFTPRRLDEQTPEPAEPPVEGLPERSKAIADYTPEESAAQRASFDRTMREQARREEAERREQEQRRQAEANRTDDQRLGDSVVEALGAKPARNAALLRSLGMLHGDEGQEK